MMRRFGRAAAAFAACLALLGGCSWDANRPVSGLKATTPAITAKPPMTPRPLPTRTPAELSPSPVLTETPQPTARPAAYAFPMGAAGLFGSAKAPDGFSRPLWLSGDAQAFLFFTADSAVFRAQWDGSGYAVSPVAENIAAGSPANACVDEQSGALFCQGSRAYPEGGTGGCAVMVDLSDGSRCNVEDYVGWKESGTVLSPAFQYQDGFMLAEVMRNEGGKLAPTMRWALADLARKTCAALDFAGFREKNLPQWQEMTELRLALAGKERLLAVCRARGPIPQPTGGKDAEACYAFLLDLNGNVLKSTVLAPSAGSAFLTGLCFTASPDGKYLLYGSSGAAGAFLFDVEKCAETLIPGSDAAGLSFLQWGKDGEIYYGLEGRAPEHGGMIYRTNVQAILGQE